jgi:hypothetical protein
VVRDTIRKRGRWGINTSPVVCLKCGTAAPAIRKPASFRQFLWGGWTCAECGFELDKWGHPVHSDGARQPSPPADSRIRKAREDLHRGDYRA